jgi:hypothetical protein
MIRGAAGEPLRTVSKPAHIILPDVGTLQP